jgi:hypothetical protein
MANVLKKGHGDRGDVGGFLDVTFVPDSTFETELDALVAAGTKVDGKLVQIVTTGNYEVTSPAQSAIPDGKIVSWKKTKSGSASSYLLTVRLFHYVTQNSGHFTPIYIINLEYDASSKMALGDTIVCYDSGYRDVTDGDTGGYGFVVSLDSTNRTADVIF